MDLKKLWDQNHRGHALLLAAAVVAAGLAWAFAELASGAQKAFGLALAAWPWAVAAAAPLFFLAAAWLVRRFAPEAAGSGIPQVLRAIDRAERTGRDAGALVSLRTAVVKMASASLGLLGGASIGREGPTVQISASVFAAASERVGGAASQAWRRAFLVAGAAAGVSAAFNTPLAGISFAIEELAEEGFGATKRAVMLAVIVAGIAARALGGNYLFFGHPNLADPSPAVLAYALLAGSLGGALGGLFARALTRPWTGLLPATWWKRALLCGALVSAFSLASEGLTAGSGYEAARGLMDAPGAGLPAAFFPAKFLVTAVSYLSGIAGGIFSPCLSIGAGLGELLGRLFERVDPRACALIGMVAFFSGVVHAPLTAVIIVMEMTDQHLLIIPFLAAAYLAHGAGTLVMPVPLYRRLAALQEEEKTSP